MVVYSSECGAGVIVTYCGGQWGKADDADDDEHSQQWESNNSIQANVQSFDCLFYFTF